MIRAQVGTGPTVVVRSAEVRGEERSAAEPSRGASRLDLLSAVLTGVSVFLMAITVVLRIRRGTLPGLSGKQDALFYIPARLGLPEIANEMRLADAFLTYMRMADILLAYGLSGTDEEREKAILALKSLLLIKNVAEESLSSITRNLRLLSRTEVSDQQISVLRNTAVPVQKQLDLRARIDGLLAEQSVSKDGRSQT